MTTCARRWASSSRCTCPSPGWRCCRSILGLPDHLQPDPHRLPRDGHRSGLHAGLRGRDRRGGRHAPSAASAGAAVVLLAARRSGACCRACWCLCWSAPSIVIASQRGMPADEVRALTFFSLVLSIVSLILVNRSFSTSLVTAIRRANPRWRGSRCGRRHSRAQPAGAGTAEPVQLRSAALGRSQPDARRRGNHSGRARACQDVLARPASVLICATYQPLSATSITAQHSHIPYSQTQFTCFPEFIPCFHG